MVKWKTHEYSLKMKRFIEETCQIPGGGGHSGTEGGRTFVTYFAEEGVFF